MAYHGFFQKEKTKENLEQKAPFYSMCEKSQFLLLSSPYNNNHHILKTDFYFSCIHTKVLANVTTKLIKQKKCISASKYDCTQMCFLKKSIVKFADFGRPQLNSFIAEDHKEQKYCVENK